MRGSSSRRRAARAVDRVRPRACPSTRSIARRYSGLARIDVGDGARVGEQLVEPLALRASAPQPGRRARRSRRRPAPAAARRSRTPAASRRPSPTAQASVTEARSWPRRRVRRTWTAPRGPSGSGSSIAVDELAGAERRDARTDEELVDRDRPPSARPDRDDPRAVDEQRRRRVGRRRRVADVPGQRRPVPDLDRPDDRRRLGQRRVVAPDPLVAR